MAAGGGRSRSQRRLAVGGGDGCGRRAGEERSVCANGRCRSSPVGDSVTAKANALLATATAKAKAATRSNRELRKASDGGTSACRAAISRWPKKGGGRVLVGEAWRRSRRPAASGGGARAAGDGGEGGPGGRWRRRRWTWRAAAEAPRQPVAEAELARAAGCGGGGGACVR
ncbi:Os10g0515650 [Oryza sativa Japonica Group]|uniref:Os10g0515650 protein n=1 Tax=Oryza sativa subsp. japonica TaxID=39947 RepID=A0A0P0XW84_ORYSJ|nr:Os10g0515650 [Oryza sativa Japonica Group]